MRNTIRSVYAIALALAAAGCGSDQLTNPVREPGGPAKATFVYTPVVYYSAYVEGIGWQPAVTNGQVAGTTGQFRRMEALKINAYAYTAMDPPVVVCYQAHVENIGWQQAVCGNGKMVGTVGQDLRMEAVRIWFIDPSGFSSSAYGVCYHVHVEDYGWMSNVCNGAQAGTTGEFRRIEAITISPYVRSF